LIKRVIRLSSFYIWEIYRKQGYSFPDKNKPCIN
jgi:hypothetical protein